MVIGIDEVGRGAWAGPLVFAAVAFPRVVPFINELNDSKKLSRAQRASLYNKIIGSAHYAISEISSVEIDSSNLTLCSTKACEALLSKFSLDNIEAIILDGNVNYLKNFQPSELVTTIIKADESIPEVMAASIIAKHHRDTIMCDFALKYPSYDFQNNVGYGTARHKQALSEHGVLEIHRTSYRPVRDHL